MTEGQQNPPSEMAARIRDKLRAALAPQELRVIDESHRHQGHAGHRPGGGSHFRVEIVSDAFAGQSRLARQRMVNAALAQEFAAGVHALSISARTADEA